MTQYVRSPTNDTIFFAPGRRRARAAQEAAYRFMSVMAGDREGFEEAARALFAHDAARFDGIVAKWPKDIRAHTHKLAAACLQYQPETASARGGDKPQLAV